MYIPTLKEGVQENEPLNYRLLSRAGYIRKSAAGIYCLLPLGAMALGRLQSLIASSLGDRDCFEIKPALTQSLEYTLKLMGVGRLTYKELPLGAWYTKEQEALSIRPRLGLIYPKVWQSLQGFKLVRDEEKLNSEFECIRKPFQTIMEALRINYIEVERLSEHFMGQKDLRLFLPYKSGEESIVRCTKCGKTITMDSLGCSQPYKAEAEEKELNMVHTPGVKTIQDVAGFLNIKASDIVKTLIYRADDRLVGVLIRGDRELSEIKLKNILNCNSLTQANADEVFQATGAEVGFAGPIGLKAQIICDFETAAAKAIVVGANKTDFHYINASIDRDFKADIIADVRCAEASDLCDQCGGDVEMINGFTLAELNKMGKTYTNTLDLTFINSDGALDTIHILNFDFNLYRLLAAAVETGSDEAGICMPKAVAPFDIVVMPVHADNEQQSKAAEEIYGLLQEKGLDVLLDDRNERVGSKFKDSELIGIPLRITIGRKVTEGIVEVKLRTGDMREIHINEIMDYVMENEIGFAVRA
jgi:prolyl-tRNA synthetase